MAQEQRFEQTGEEKEVTCPWIAPLSASAVSTITTGDAGSERTKRLQRHLAGHRTPSPDRIVVNVTAWSATALLCANFFGQLAQPDASGVTLLIAGAVLVGNWFLKKEDIAAAARTLDDYDAQWIGSLFEALPSANKRVRTIVTTRLVRMLNTMTAADARLLTPRDRATIQNFLMKPHHYELRIAILDALPSFGDAFSIPIVEKLAKAYARTSSDERLRLAARTCLPQLRDQVRDRMSRAAEHDVASPSEMETAPSLQRTLHWRNGIDSRADAAAKTNSAELALLEAERVKVARPGMRMGFLIADWLIIVPYGLTQTIGAVSEHSLFVAACWAATTLAATQLYRVSLSSTRVELMRKQARQRDIKAVGLLAEALTWPEQSIQREAGTALTVLLPLLKANHAALLSAAQRECLHQRLTLQHARTDSNLIVAILQSFQQIGDTAAIPYVERLADARARSRAEAQVVQEAQECLPYLRLCASNNAASHSLLRASDMTAAAARDNLLRPAREQPDTKPEQLLRPGSSDTQ
jgi:hypothetical protein